MSSLRTIFLAVAGVLPVLAQITITTPSPLPTGVVSRSYNVTLNATGGLGSFYLWTWSGNIPPGLSLGSTDGQITGIPTTASTYNFTVNAFDGEVSGNKAFVLKINTLIVVNSNFVWQGRVGVPFDQTLTATGGENNGRPYTWAVIPSTPLPAGLTLNPATGRITGTPTGPPGTYTVFVTATDTATPTQTSNPTPIQIDILPPLLTIVTTSPLPRAVQGVAYALTFAATGGTPGYAWGLVEGSSLPPGLTLTPAGMLAGTPTQTGTFSFTVEVVDNQGSSNGPPPQTATRTFSLAVVPLLQITTATPLPPGRQGDPYSQSLQAGGGVPPYAWTVTGGALPAGLTLSSAGVLSGTSTVSGVFSFTARVADTSAQNQSRTYSLTIQPPVLVITTGSPLPPGVAGTAYSSALAASGGTPPYAWSVSAGALPPGLTLNASTGAITGTPTTAGSYNFTARVQDSSSPSAQSATRAFNVRIDPPALVITTASPLPAGMAGKPYSLTLAGTGGIPPYTWQVASGQLPAGLTLSTAGGLSGTPSTAGTYNFTIRLRDASAGTPAEVDKAFVLQINPSDLTITTSSPLPQVEPGAPYNLTLAATGGTPPYTWSVVGGNLPPGVILSSGGLLTGTVTQAGTYTFSVRVADGTNQTATKTFTITVEQRITPLEITTTSLPDGSVGVFYGATVHARGGTEPYGFSIGGLPPGVEGNSNGGIAGTPTRSGAYPVRVTVTDNVGRQASATFTVTIRAGQIEITTPSVSEGRVDASYSVTFGARGGVPPYTWSLAGGSLPGGLSLSTSGDLSGTPTQAGTFTFTVQAADTEKQVGTKGFTLIVRTAALTITTATLPNGTAGSSYSATVAGTGGTRPYKWSMSGSVPEGLGINAETGDITGTPAAAGTYTLNVSVSDVDGQSSNKGFTITIAPALLITTESPLPPLTVGVAGGASFAATGGVPPYVWGVSSGTVPPGMSFSAGQLSGTPSAAGSYSFSVQVTDANRGSTSKSFTVEVLSTLRITTETLPGATAGTAYSASLAATGGTPPYRWSSTGSLPPGLSVDEGGNISGTPSAGGTFSFTVEVRDSAQPNTATNSRSLSIVVSLPQISTVTIGGLPANPMAAQQPTINLSIGAPFPAAITGTMTLAFSPDAANNADDPAIQFSTGGRTVAFNIPAGQTQAVFPTSNLMLSTGTTAGTITLTPSFSSGGNPVQCACPATTVRIPRTAPAITSVRVTPTANGFNLIITGYSSTREITRAVFRFSGSSALQTSEVIVPLTDPFNAYFRGNSQFGGQFSLTVPFVIQGEAGAVTSVTVLMTNSVGDSQSSTASL